MRRPLQLLVPYAWTVRALGCAPAAAQVLPGDWRPEAAASAQPLLAPVDCAPGDTSCIEEHGTFGRDPYLRIVEAADGSLNLTSDGALHASVVRRPNRPKVYDVQIAGGGRAILTLHTPGCFEEASCFEIAGSTDPTDLANAVYVPVQPLESKGLTQSLADMFASVLANFDTPPQSGRALRRGGQRLAELV